MAKHRRHSDRTTTALTGALLAGGMFLALPAAIASAGPGINGRPDVPNDQPVVDAIQQRADPVFDNVKVRRPLRGTVTLGQTGLGLAYHGLFGRSVASANVRDPEATEGTQGLIVGVRNVVPRLKNCNLTVQHGCK